MDPAIAAMHPKPAPPTATVASTVNGAVDADPRNSLTVGPRGPMLMADVHFLQKHQSFNRERIPGACRGGREQRNDRSCDDGGRGVQGSAARQRSVCVGVVAEPRGPRSMALRNSS